MGGWKESGIGTRWGGATGILKYCRQQAITVPRIPPQKSEPIWLPHSPRKYKFTLGLMRAATGRGLRRLGRTPKRGG
jgi:hypothetical protein